MAETLRLLAHRVVNVIAKERVSGMFQIHEMLGVYRKVKMA